MVRTLRLRKAAAETPRGNEGTGSQSAEDASPPADTPPKPAHDKPPRQDHPLLRKFEIRRGEDA